MVVVGVPVDVGLGVVVGVPLGVGIGVVVGVGVRGDGGVGVGVPPVLNWMSSTGCSSMPLGATPV